MLEAELGGTMMRRTREGGSLLQWLFFRLYILAGSSCHSPQSKEDATEHDARQD